MENQNFNQMPTEPVKPVMPLVQEMPKLNMSMATKYLNKDKILIGLAIVAVIITGVLVYGKIAKKDMLGWINISLPMSKEAIAKKSVDYLNANVLSQGQTAELGEISEVSGIVKMQLKINGNTYDSYATKDGKLFFPEAFNIGEAGN